MKDDIASTKLGCPISIDVLIEISVAYLTELVEAFLRRIREGFASDIERLRGHAVETRTATCPTWKVHTDII